VRGSRGFTFDVGTKKVARLLDGLAMLPGANASGFTFSLLIPDSRSSTFPPSEDDPDPTKASNFKNQFNDGAWPRFHWQGLVLGQDGALRLPGLPAFEGSMAPALQDAAPPAAGLAADADGSVYFSDPASDTVWRIDGCFGAGDRAAAPRAVHRGRGNHCVKIVDLDSMTLSEVLDGFDTPRSLALDDAGRLYVADAGVRRVELFTDTGDRVAGFGDMVRASAHADNPGAVACDGARVFVLDLSTHELCVFSQDALLEVIATGIEGARLHGDRWDDLRA